MAYGILVPPGDVPATAVIVQCTLLTSSGAKHERSERVHR